MIQRIFILYIFLLIGIPLTFLTVYFGLNYSGFCFAKMRYLTDEEKIKLAFNSLNSAEKLRIQIEGEMQDRKFIKYESFDEYIKENPDCCAVNPPGGVEALPDSFLTRILGLHSGDGIRIKFKVRYLDESGLQKSQEINSGIALQNCGQTVNFD